MTFDLVELHSEWSCYFFKRGCNCTRTVGACLVAPPISFGVRAQEVATANRTKDLSFYMYFRCLLFIRKSGKSETHSELSLKYGWMNELQVWSTTCVWPSWHQNRCLNRDSLAKSPPRTEGCAHRRDVSRCRKPKLSILNCFLVNSYRVAIRVAFHFYRAYLCVSSLA